MFAFSRLLVCIFVIITSLSNTFADMSNNADKAATALSHINVIDGTGAPLQENITLVIKGGDIVDMFPSAQNKTRLPQDSQLVDGKGMYVMPGLIDTHVHLATIANKQWAEAVLRRGLYGGITTVRDMAGDVRSLADLSRAALVDEISAPDIHYSSLMAGPAFFKDPRTISSSMGLTPGEVPWMQSVDDSTDISRATLIAKGTSATGIKIYASVSAKNIKKITENAHKENIKVWAHSAVFPAKPSQIVATGVDGISHICMLAWELEENVPAVYQKKHQPNYSALLSGGRVPAAIEKLFQQMRKSGTIIDPNLRLYKELQAREHSANNDKSGRKYCSPDIAAGLTSAAYLAGVSISTGTDGNTDIKSNTYPALLEEMELMVTQANIKPLHVIQSATQMGARVLGIENTHGTLEVGKRANLVVVSKNPLENISNIRSIQWVMKNGKRYQRSEFRLPSLSNAVEQ